MPDTLLEQWYISDEDRAVRRLSSTKYSMYSIMTEPEQLLEIKTVDLTKCTKEEIQSGLEVLGWEYDAESNRLYLKGQPDQLQSNSDEETEFLIAENLMTHGGSGTWYRRIPWRNAAHLEKLLIKHRFPPKTKNLLLNSVS